jgi:hypothetical protein
VKNLFPVSVLWFVLFYSAAAQTTIQVGTIYNFSQSPQSTARYQLNIQSPGEFTIHINNWLSTYDWGDDFDRIYIYNDSTKPIGRNDLSSGSDPFLFHMFQDTTNRLTFRVGLAGVYYINVHSGQVKDWGTATSQSYSLVVNALYCNDIYEPNNDIAHATPISIGQKISAFQWRGVNTVQVWGDEDWYKIQLNSPGKLTIQLVKWIGTYNWSADFDRLYVYNGNGQSIGSSGGYPFYSWMMGGGTDSVPVSISMNLSHAGTYYLQFHSGNGTNTIPYSLTTSLIPMNDPFEPNEEFLIAKPIALDTTNYACEWRSVDSSMNVAGDEDYYYFTASQSGSYILTLKNWIGIYNWGADYDRLWVYDANKNVIGPNPYNWMMGGGVPMTINIPSPGVYYIRLHCGSTYSIDGYTFKLTSPSVGINDKYEIPHEYSLLPNYPNPFNPSTTIKYALPGLSNVQLTVYDIMGREVKMLVTGNQATGYKEVVWDGRNNNGTEVSSGIYIYHLKASSLVDGKVFEKSQKLVLMK